MLTPKYFFSTSRRQRFAVIGCCMPGMHRPSIVVDCRRQRSLSNTPNGLEQLEFSSLAAD